MSDEELKREAVEAADSICRRAGIETTWPDSEDILAALRRVRDAATAAERQRCAAVCKAIADGAREERRWENDRDWDGREAAALDCAAAIERQEGEG